MPQSKHAAIEQRERCLASYDIVSNYVKSETGFILSEHAYKRAIQRIKIARNPYDFKMFLVKAIKLGSKAIETRQRHRPGHGNCVMTSTIYTYEDYKVIVSYRQISTVMYNGTSKKLKRYQENRVKYIFNEDRQV